MKLKDIDHPEKIKKLTIGELEDLANQIREVIIDTVARNGGHIASSLGAVELAIALHYCFESPKDRIIWDVGHQAYAHKLLTGRYRDFHTLRTLNGLSGFLKREESVHDTLDTGHSSTSISAGIGLACARDMRKEDYYIISVIGDGALTGGMALEALNYLGHIKKDRFIIIINDNEMSISQNVGALSRYLTRLRVEPFYFRFKEDVQYILNNVPAIGSRMIEIVKRLKSGLKHLFLPGQFFEELGYQYFGPVDGHNLESLIDLLKRVKNKVRGPVIIHAITKKGKGYRPAEENPSKFHGLGPFNRDNGKKLKKSKVTTYTEVFARRLVELAREDSRITAITAAMPDGTGLNKFARVFPKRFYDVGICEQHATTMAAGMALGGLKPVVAIYSTFLQRAYDQIVHDICLPNLPVVFCLDRAGIVGEDGPTHHGMFDISCLRALPNMVVMAPKDENELGDLLRTALALGRPVAIRYPRGAGRGVELSKETNKITLGSWEILREGEQVIMLAVGIMVETAEKTADMLKKAGISAGVVNARFIKPLDERLLKAVFAKKIPVVTLEEGIIAGGFGSAVMEFAEKKRLNGSRIMRIGIDDVFVPAGSQDELRKLMKIDPASVAEKVKEFLGDRGKSKKN